MYFALWQESLPSPLSQMDLVSRWPSVHLESRTEAHLKTRQQLLSPSILSAV